jgi:hypothetical protein
VVAIIKKERGLTQEEAETEAPRDFRGGLEGESLYRALLAVLEAIDDLFPIPPEKRGERREKLRAIVAADG